ncbi:hypothetical protein DCD74_07110 [Lysobacter oculi]|uniref:Uncharacterized protein n=1 Tax=Solilutibacter oculi TaxID=2698682 RepID=A0A344J623_9GAMM|nr:hypothetical protein [Lysobacter oculi]AXA84483.1 hypothetical protein DCD74_07110 [Lysobacter oculi]
MASITPPRIIPITDFDVIQQSWETIELTCTRRTMRAALVRGLCSPEGTWVDALVECRPVFNDILRKSRMYADSVNQMLRARQLPLASRLEDAIAVAKACHPADQLVCHVAMTRTYCWLQATIEHVRIGHRDPGDFLDRLMSELENRALVLWDEEKRAWAYVVEECMQGGLDVSTIRPLQSPFGIDDSGPCWILEQIDIDLAW